VDAIWTDLEHILRVYQVEYVQGDCDDDESDGVGISAVVYSSLDFIQLVARKKIVRPILLQHLNKLSNILMVYLQITGSMEEAWRRDMNQFIQDDDDDAVSHSVRIAVDQCLVNLVDAFGKDMIVALIASCSDALTVGTNEREGGIEGWWKKHESALFLLGRFSSLVAVNAEPGFINTLFQQIVVLDMKCFAYPFLQGRALWFASQYGDYLTRGVINDYVHSSVEALSSTAVALPVRVFAMKSIRGFLSSSNKDQVRPYQKEIIESLVGLAQEAREDALILLLEVLTLAVSVISFLSRLIQL
jgi:importin-9